MEIAIIGTNGMLSEALTKSFIEDGHTVDVYGLYVPNNYPFTNFYQCDLLKDKLDFVELIKYQIIIYASGAGVQAALSTPSWLMYELNVHIPINICLELNNNNYNGCFISFGSYMEIGQNEIVGKSFKEDEVVCSPLPVSNDYALSKRLYSRFMKDFHGSFTHWHFILPNMFSYNDKKPGTRLIPYILEYCRDFKSGMNPATPKFSAGAQTRQYILLEEIKTVIEKAVKCDLKSGIYNIGGGTFSSIRETIEKIFNAFGVPCCDSYFGKSERRDCDIRSLKIDGSKLMNSINFLPSKTITEILCD